MNQQSLKPSGGASVQSDAMKLQRFASLQDWRRQIADLYAAVRTMQPEAA